MNDENPICPDCDAAIGQDGCHCPEGYPMTGFHQTIRHTDIKSPKISDAAYDHIVAMDMVTMEQMSGQFIIDSLGTYTAAEQEEDTPTAEQILSDMRRIMEDMKNDPPIHLRPYQVDYLKKLMKTDLKMSVDHGSRGHSKSMMMQSMQYAAFGPQRFSGLTPSLYIVDDPWFDDIKSAPADIEPDWKRTKFVSGGSTAPSADKRAKLRAKRKKKGKSK